MFSTNKEILHFFYPSIELTQAFVKEYNGKGLDKFSLRLMDALHTNESAKYMLSNAVESALIETFSQVSHHEYRTLSKEKEILLEEALMKRIPKISETNKIQLADLLIKELKDSLKDKDLAIDGGIVSLVDESMVVQVTK